MNPLVNCLVASTIQHGIYGFIFYSTWLRSVLKNNHWSFIFCCYLMKIWSGYQYLLYLLPLPIYASWSTILISLLSIGYGIHLNLKVHELLGIQSIYYGYELGVKPLTWIESYPYSMIKDPQYVGIGLQYSGVSLTYLCTPDSIRWDVLFSCLYLCGLYKVTSWIESS
jgi:hypothetical protein